jgi:hypothetical protein
MTAYEKVKVQLYSFLTWSLDGIQWLASRAGRSNPEESTPVTHLTRNWVASEAILSIWKKNNSLGHVGNRTMIPLLVTIPTELSRVRQEYETIKHSRTVSLCSSTLPRLACCMFGQDWSSSRYLRIFGNAPSVSIYITDFIRVCHLSSTMNRETTAGKVTVFTINHIYLNVK